MYRTSDSHLAGPRTLARLAAVAGVAILALLWTGTAASAYPVQTGDLATSGALIPGGTVQLSGGGYASGTEVSIDVYSVAMHLKSVTTDGAGEFSATVTLPSSLSPGRHELQATGAAADGGVLILTQVFTVAGSGDGDDDELPVTGWPAVNLAAIGLAAIGTGIAVLWHAMRRRTSRSVTGRDG